MADEQARLHSGRIGRMVGARVWPPIGPLLVHVLVHVCRGKGVGAAAEQATLLG